MRSGMNWRRGFQRLWKFLLGLMCLGWIGASIVDGDIKRIGETLGHFIIFACAWMLLGRALDWVFAGFSSSE